MCQLCLSFWQRQNISDRFFQLCLPFYPCPNIPDIFLAQKLKIHIFTFPLQLLHSALIRSEANTLQFLLIYRPVQLEEGGSACQAAFEGGCNPPGGIAIIIHLQLMTFDAAPIISYINCHHHPSTINNDIVPNQHKKLWLSGPNPLTMKKAFKKWKDHRPSFDEMHSEDQKARPR